MRVYIGLGVYGCASHAMLQICVKICMYISTVCIRIQHVCEDKHTFYRRVVLKLICKVNSPLCLCLSLSSVSLSLSVDCLYLSL